MARGKIVHGHPGVSDSNSGARPKKRVSRPLVIGITGGVGSGKSLVANEFTRLGAQIISGDRVGHAVVDNNPALQRRLARVFGEEVVANKRVNRKMLARRAFANPESRRTLNRLVHPYLLRELIRRIDHLRKDRSLPAVVVDAALLVEWNLRRPLDVMIAVWASRDNRRRWLRARGWSDREIQDRMRSQLPFAVRARAADYVLRNDGDRAALRRKARRLWQKFVVLR